MVQTLILFEFSKIWAVFLKSIKFHQLVFKMIISNKSLCVTDKMAVLILSAILCFSLVLKNANFYQNFILYKNQSMDIGRINTGSNIVQPKTLTCFKNWQNNSNFHVFVDQK